MDLFLKDQLRRNSLTFKMSLDRIAEKYSKPQYQHGGVEVDINNIDFRALEGYMQQSRTEMNKLESQSLTDVRDDSMRSQDITGDSQLDFTHEDGGAMESCVSSVSSTQFLEDPVMASRHTTQLTVSSLDESRRSLSELLPEDLDEDLEMSLRSHGSSLVDLYPSMISRIGKAWHRQHVSDAAGSVLKRYRRWRQKPNRSVNNTFVVSQRQGNPNKTISKTLLKETLNSPMEIQYLEADATPRSPLKTITSAQDWQTHQQSPRRMRGSQHQPVLVMDFSDSSETYKPNDFPLNETFDVSEQPSAYAVSPSRPFFPTAKASLDLSLRSKRLSLAAPSPQTDVWSVCASQERQDIYSSPVRQSPLKARMLAGLLRSPLSRSPSAQSVESISRLPTRRRSLSTSLSSPHKPTVQPRMLYAQDSHHPLQPQRPSPQSAAGEPHRLRRHLSFDSSILQSTHVSYLPEKIDEDFVKLYHKFVCQDKSSAFNGALCRHCARSSEASRGHTESSALAALALSPHRSLLRKRHRVIGWDCHPQSKRPRDEYSSPGSKRHQMLRCRLSASENELPRDHFSFSPSKHRLFQRSSSQQHSADLHQETWMSRGHDLSAADYSSLGRSLESNMTCSRSPRKWW